MRISKKWFRQADKIEWVVLIATLLFVIPFVSKRIFGGFWDTTPAQTIQIIGWVVAVFMSFVFGIRGVRLDGFISKSVGYLLGGTFLSITLIGINIAILIIVPKTLDLVSTSDEKMSKFESRLEDPNLDSKRKALVSKIIASNKYQQSGEIVVVYDKDGTVSEYLPTETDKNILEGLTDIKRQIDSIKKSTFIFTSILIISILVGTLTPIKKIANGIKP